MLYFLNDCKLRGLTSVTTCMISYGANISGPFGEPVKTLEFALKELKIRNLSIIKESKLYSSLAFPYSSEPRYLNGCFEIEVHCSAHAVLGHLKEVEVKMGRRENSRWGSRACDLDLLSFANTVCPSNELFDHWYKMPLKQQIVEKPHQLLLPHPRLQDRAFVLKPLMDFAEDWIHPILNLSVKEMFASLPKEDRDSVLPI